MAASVAYAIAGLYLYLFDPEGEKLGYPIPSFLALCSVIFLLSAITSVLITACVSAAIANYISDFTQVSPVVHDRAAAQVASQ